MMKLTSSYLMLLLAVLLNNQKVAAQHVHFVENGIIEFEKRANIYAITTKKISAGIDTYLASAFEAYKKNNPQFQVSVSTLNFTKDKSLYQFPQSDQVFSNSWISDPIADLKNIIFTDFRTDSSITQKNVYETKYLVKDAVRKINWKITDETREIAGYQCRRANAIILDSVYVVAYYTNEIAVSGGPESFGGLPGMILGLALPHDHITWFAKSVKEVAIQEKDLKAPAKGKATNNKSLREVLDGAMKDWGEYGKPMLKALSL